MNHIIPVWGNEHTKLKYERKPILPRLLEDWHMCGYTHENHSGILYDESNNKSMPDYINDLKKIFSFLKDPTFAFYKMEQMTIMPNHSDHYEGYCKYTGADREKVVRVLVFLEDWKSGHYLEIDNKAYTNWKAGDWLQWSHEEHMAANIGTEPRYTLQITAHV